MTRSDREPSNHRRHFLAGASTAVMAGGLFAGYGTFAVVAGRFLYNVEDEDTAWQFVAAADEMDVGQALSYVSPSGVRVVVARQGPGALAEDFVALSSVCPHLGCQVHWEPHKDRFFCPCHNAAFDRQGQATEGPPAKSKQTLVRFRTKVESGMLFILAPIKTIT